MKRRKTGLLILGFSILLLSVVGVTYAYWSLNLKQTDEDQIASSCFNIKLMDEQNAIQLDKAYPILDSEGEQLTPYKFTITNKCEANAKYQINLESLNKIDGTTIIEEENKLGAQYLKVKLNEENKGGSIHLLNEDEVEHTLKDAYEAHKLTIGYLGPKESKTYELRLWLDGDLTMEDKEAMNKTYAGKITITATYSKNKYDTLVDTILALTPQEEDSGETGLYAVTHNDANITYTTDPFYQNRLKQTEYRYAGKEPNNYVSADVATEDRYELVMCLKMENQEMCRSGLELNELSDIEVKEFYIDSAFCESKKEKVEFAIKDMLSSLPPSMTYTLDCKKTASAGDAINLWRIIGLVNTPEGQRVKLIKDTSIGNYSWDTSASGINKGWGVNEWSQSDLMKLLNPGYDLNELENGSGEVLFGENVNNSLYWNGEEGKCYAGQSNMITDCDFTNNTISDNLKKMIDEVTWNTGNDKGFEEFVSQFYEYERSNNTRKICNSNTLSCTETIDRTASWKGKVGLIYSSDYGYATSGGTKGREGDTGCFATNLYSWDLGDDQTQCAGNDWLLPLDTIDWTLVPITAWSDVYCVYGVHYSGLLNENVTSYAGNVRPSVYLKPDVLVSSGNGSKKSPYFLDI